MQPEPSSSNEESKVRFIGVQLQTINVLSKIIAERIPVNDMLVKEYMRTAVTNWQTKTHQKFIGLHLKSPIERIEIIQGVMNELTQQLKQNLPSNYRFDDIEQAVDNGMDYFVEKMAHKDAWH